MQNILARCIAQSSSQPRDVELIMLIVHEPDPENLAFTTTWGGKFPLYFSESHISWDVISA